MGHNNWKYWTKLLKKLNYSNNLDATSQDILVDLCQYFGFGIGVIYEADYKGNYQLLKTYKKYHDHLSASLKRHDLFSLEEEAILRLRNVIYYWNWHTKNMLEEKLLSFFCAKSLIMVPVFGSQNQIVVIVGMIQRRKTETSSLPLNTNGISYSIIE